MDDRAIRPDEFISKTYKQINLFLSGNQIKRKELLDNFAWYINNDGSDIPLLFSNWSKDEIEKLEEEVREKYTNFSKIENYSMCDLYRFLIGII